MDDEALGKGVLNPNSALVFGMKWADFPEKDGNSKTVGGEGCRWHCEEQIVAPECRRR